MTDVLPRFLIFAAATVVAQIPQDMLSSIEKFGIVGVLAMFCWLLWQRDEKRNAQFAHLLERFLDGQSNTNEELRKQSKILEQRAHRRNEEDE